MQWGQRAAVVAGFCVGVTGVNPSLAADTSPMPVKAAVQSADQAWAVSYNSEVRWFTWTNTRGFPTILAPLSGDGRGSQLYIPMSLSVSGSPNPNWKLEFVLRGGYVSASQDTAGNRGSVSTTTDTQASGTATYNGFTGFQPFVGLLMNLPTGKSALYGNSRFARMDSDLVDIGSYGEGWNFGPTAGVNIPITQALMFTLSGGYTFRGKYDKESADPITTLITATDSVKNGDEATVTAALGYSQGPLALQGSASYSWDGVSEVIGPGANQYRVGPRTTISGSASYAWNDQWSSNANAFWVHTEKNEVLALGVLVPEGFDTNNDLFRINTGLTYRMANGVSTGPIAGFLYRNRNSWNPATLTFVPAKTRWSAGGMAAYNVTNKISINSRVEKVWINESEFPGPGAPPSLAPAMSGDAWQLAFGATVNF